MNTTSNSYLYSFITGMQQYNICKHRNVIESVYSIIIPVMYYYLIHLFLNDE